MQNERKSKKKEEEEDETKTKRNLAKNHFQNKKIFEKKQKKTPEENTQYSRLTFLPDS